MLDLKKTNAPEAIELDGTFYPIHTDFRYWLNFSSMLEEKHTYLDFDFFYKAEKPEDRVAGFNALLDFFINKNELPRVSENGISTRTIDYDIDSDLIFSAFYERYGIDLMQADLHWHKFKALLSGLHGTKLNDVIGYRLYDPSDKTKHEQAMLENKRMWELPEKLTEEEQEVIDDFDRRLKK